MTRAAIDVFADTVCPFAHVGLWRFVRRRGELGSAHPVLRVRAWPLEIVNGEPMDAGAVAKHVAALREQVEPGLFRGFDRASFPRSSLLSLALVPDAYATSDVLGERVSLAVRDALFEEGGDIGDPVVLAAIAECWGLGVPTAVGEHAVLADLAVGKQRGVQGSPEFFLGERGYFCPALRIEHIEGNLEITPNRETFDVFLSDCFR